MIRSLNPDPFNRISNHPSVRPWMGYGCGPLDVSNIVTDPANFCLLTPNHDGGYILKRLDAGLYEAHSAALPSARGKPMLTLMREGFEWLFTATECVEVVSVFPDGNDAASRWGDIAGFRRVWRRDAYMPMMGETVGASFGSLGYVDWALRHKPNIARGQAFHDQLHARNLTNHPEDPAHDAMVGATIAGCLAGNIVKAVSLFNRWAVQAGYMPSTILSLTPPTIHTGDAILTLHEGQVQILSVCRNSSDNVVSPRDGEAVPMDHHLETV